jgi:hypothetical protein
VLREMARVVRPGGLVAVFDGDYASMTYALRRPRIRPADGCRPGYRQFQQSADHARNAGPDARAWACRCSMAWGDAVVEIGKASYFRSFAETYVPFVIKAGLFSAEAAEAWLRAQHQSMEDGTFFASCNYYTYLTNRV